MKFDTIESMKASGAAYANNDLAYVLQYRSGKQGGGGHFYWDSTSVEPGNDGTIITPNPPETDPPPPVIGRWKRIVDGPMDVKCFGAAGDGVTDDSLSIMAALNAGYYDLYFPKGTYLIADNAVIGGNFEKMSIRGENRESTLLLKNGSSPIALISSAGSNVTIENISVSAPNSTVTNGLIEITAGDNIVVRNCSLKSGMRAFWLRCAAHRTISNVEFSGNIIDDVKDGIIIGNIDPAIGDDEIINVRITNNTIINGKGSDENTGGDAIKAGKKCTHLVIADNYIKGFVRDAIDLFASGDRVIITSNYLLNSGVKAIDIKANVSDYTHEVWGNGGRNIVIGENIIEGNATGISIARNVAMSTDYNYLIDVSHNQFLNNTQTCIQAYGKHINISDNFFSENGTNTAGAFHCIQCGDNTLERTLENAVISGNMFVNNGNMENDDVQYAIYVSRGAKKCNLLGNTVVNDGPIDIQRNGIYVNIDTTDIKLRNNSIKDLSGAAYTFINGAGVDTDFVAGSKDGFTLQNITATGNKTNNGIDHVFKTEANGLRDILQPADAYFLDNSSSVTGAVKITLPFGWNNTIIAIRLIGNNYNQGVGQQFEINVTGMNASAGPGWTSASVSVTGKNPFGSLVRLAYDGAKCCIIIGDISSQWSRPKIWVQSIMTSYTGGANTWDIGWSSSLLTSLTGITSVVTPPLENFIPAAANGIATLDATGKVPLSQLPATLSGSMLLKDFYTEKSSLATAAGIYSSLYSYTIPGDTLRHDGEKIIAEFAGNLADNPNVKELALSVGETQVSQLLPATNGDWLLKAVITRTSTDTVQLRYQLDGSPVTLTKIGGLNFNAPVKLELNGTSPQGNVGDITACTGTVEWKSAAS